MVSHKLVAVVVACAPLLGLVQAQVAGQCSGQSCYAAELSTSTGQPWKLKNGKPPAGGKPDGDKCIKEIYAKLGLPPPEGVKRRFVLPDSLSRPDEDLLARMVGTSELERRMPESCKPHTVVFARGTLERGTLGGTVGPALQRALGGEYAVEGVSYEATVAADYCLGLPGGLKATTHLDKLAARCPNTKIIPAGYSQGAMVVRIGAAWAKPATKKQIYGFALFGDPFNGAPVKGFPQSRIKTFCNKGDAVCNGEFKISGAHLSYPRDGSVTKAAEWIKQIVSKEAAFKEGPAAAEE